ncbi:ester cyclase [Pseudomonas abietaniphila]|uniref:Predicted ester cyclase n=1 Tax=Pseudomonas abietaniphila TaxID=89065 RepID=A0A1G7RB71_9PSED|nr:ester cyclase [Pseudomonas abietaniphila]SDG08056.1 Predicted ester cyclase [Pseudomonas abietaniphila]
MRSLITGLLAVAITATVLTRPAVAAEPVLITSKVLITDPGTTPEQLQAQTLAARRYATFWSSGDPALAREALAPDFMDRALPPGRAQGIAGPLAASIAFHSAVPDLNCEVQQMIVSGDRVVSHLRFTGHFTGTFNGVKGQGQAVNFIATDIYRIADGRIAENWHLEDNLTFLQQIGVFAR